MRPDFAKLLLMVAGIDTRSPKAIALDTLMAAAKIKEPGVPEWWRWTVWIWCALASDKIKRM